MQTNIKDITAIALNGWLFRTKIAKTNKDMATNEKANIFFLGIYNKSFFFNIIAVTIEITNDATRMIQAAAGSVPITPN